MLETRVYSALTTFHTSYILLSFRSFFHTFLCTPCNVCTHLSGVRRASSILGFPCNPALDATTNRRPTVLSTAWVRLTTDEPPGEGGRDLPRGGQGKPDCLDSCSHPAWDRLASHDRTSPIQVIPSKHLTIPPRPLPVVQRSASPPCRSPRRAGAGFIPLRIRRARPHTRSSPAPRRAADALLPCPGSSGSRPA
jgi:hypothetical protein